MRIRCILSLLFAGTLTALAQTNTFNWSDLMTAADQWAQDNLDTNVLRALQEVDQQKVEQLFANLQHHFGSNSVVDMATFKKTAEAILPALDQYQETQPYAAWLRTRLDYLEVADDLRRKSLPPKVAPGQPPKQIPNPAPAKEREIWTKRLTERPWPQAAIDYVPKLKPVFVAQQVPAELVWVAEVESAFDARARSPAGARGMFQLMPATAKRFGLSLFPWDQRVHPESSARAAASYLRFLHDQFNDWRLALAAYNAGEGTVQRLLSRHKARTYDGIATHLPAETQMFVPKVEATLLRREGVALVKLPARPG